MEITEAMAHMGEEKGPAKPKMVGKGECPTKAITGGDAVEKAKNMTQHSPLSNKIGAAMSKGRPILK